MALRSIACKAWALVMRRARWRPADRLRRAVTIVGVCIIQQGAKLVKLPRHHLTLFASSTWKGILALRSRACRTWGLVMFMRGYRPLGKLGVNII